MYYDTCLSFICYKSNYLLILMISVFSFFLIHIDITVFAPDIFIVIFCLYLSSTVILFSVLSGGR